MPEPEHLVTLARSAIATYEAAGRDYADLCVQELKLEADRTLEKEAAVGRLLQTFRVNGSQHTITSAEKAVEADLEYAAYLERQRENTRSMYLARTRLESARLQAELHIARLKITQPVGAF